MRMPPSRRHARRRTRRWADGPPEKWSRVGETVELSRLCTHRLRPRRRQGGVVVMLATGRITHLEAAFDVGVGNLRSNRRADPA
ncbi:hypothetical protein GCM10027615_77060 [Plantactinospora veratri]